jgi:hypothetical protein
VIADVQALIHQIYECFTLAKSASPVVAFVVWCVVPVISDLAVAMLCRQQIKSISPGLNRGTLPNGFGRRTRKIGE